MSLGNAARTPKSNYQSNKENIFCGDANIKRNPALIAELKQDQLFQRQKYKLQPQNYDFLECTNRQGNSSRRKSSSGEGEKCAGHVGDSDGEYGDPMPQRSAVESGGFCPIQPVEPHVNANAAIVPQQPQFIYTDPNNNSIPADVGVYGGAATAAGGGGAHAQLLHCPRNHQRQQPLPTVSLPGFEQTFGHLFGRPANEMCTAYYYDNYAAPYYESVYDKSYCQADGTNRAASVITTNTDTDEAENPYKKSIACCTPAVCDSIFESLRRPCSSNDNNLIFNIPFTTEAADTTSTSVSTPRKTRYDLPQKAGKNAQSPTTNTSPYRTLSHFGFNSPQRDPQPDHKHIPPSTEQKKYVPLRKSISYEEIFSSPRYVDLCEYCFEKIVRLKPEIAQQTQMRLRNLCDYNSTVSVATARVHGGTCPGIMYTQSTDGVAYDYVEYASSDTTEETLPPFSSQLEPVLEVVEEVEPDSNEDGRNVLKSLPAISTQTPLHRTSSNSSFIEKIMRLNYSEESLNWNYAHAPHKVASSTNLTLELEHAMTEKSQNQSETGGKVCEPSTETKHYNTERESELECANMENAITRHVNVEEPTTSATSPDDVQPRRRVSVTEIWEFMQWPEEDTDEKVQGENSKDKPYAATVADQGLEGGAICLHYENARESLSNNINARENASPLENNTPRRADTANPQRNTTNTTASEESAKDERRRSLMTREERSRRKLVFQELWEDHIFFMDGKEFSRALSDTESAIDGQQEQAVASVRSRQDDEHTAECADGVEEFLLKQMEAHSSAQSTSLLAESEVFNSRSVVLKNCTQRMCNEYEDLDKITKSEILMKLQKTEVRRFSVHDLAYARREYETSITQAGLEAQESVENETSNNELNSPRAQSGLVTKDFTSLNDLDTSGSDDDQSARTYNLNASREALFFRQDKLGETAADATSCGVGSEAGEIDYAKVGANLKRDKKKVTSICPERFIPEHDSGLIYATSKPVPTGIERAKAGMALPTDQPKNKTVDNTNSDVGNLPNVRRVAQLTTEALNEPSSEVYTAPKTTKRTRRKVLNVLSKSPSCEASTSLQAAQRTTEEAVNLMYAPKSEGLCRANTPSPISPTPLVVMQETESEDNDDIAFAELLESDEHEDLTKMSEEFEELLLNVENLQSHTQRRQCGGAVEDNIEIEEAEEEELVGAVDGHFNAMERKILRKIRENQLQGREEIFDKIEMTIRNKMTPAQLEELIKEQSLNMTNDLMADESKSSHSTFTASTSGSRFLSAQTTLGESGGDSIMQEHTKNDTPDPDAAANQSSCSFEEAVGGSTRIYYRRSVDTKSTGEETTECANRSLNLRRSRSLTPSTGSCELYSPPAKLNRTTTPSRDEQPCTSWSARLSKSGDDDTSAGCKQHKIGGGARTSTRWPHVSSSTPEIKPTKRNFILENIRNASLPRRTPTSGGSSGGSGGCSLKRLQGNVQAIFCKNPFGPRNSVNNCSKMLFASISNSSLTSSTASSSRTVVKSSSRQLNKQPSPRNSLTGVYTFQSKLVRGSPRFWVSLTQPPSKKLLTQKRRRRSHHHVLCVESNDSTGSLCEQSGMRDKEDDVEEDDMEEKEDNVASQCGGELEEEIFEAASYAEGDEAGCNDIDDASRTASNGVQHELAELGEKIQQIHPRLDNYKRKMRDFGEHVAKCTRQMDECIAVQGEIVEERRQLREQMVLQQYAESVMCQVHTYSISETED
ncbi:unnamed protein product [Ceratitis capitata]|uniref:(Mediterranean fruit fly) hypothetical protein n=1 Tax=Ceratitis capitata TaxID=7213 RepID=A0A811V9E3_CERCA|nr:unnamed protein product [Ceratitis capitata]